ncbi:DEXDc helicase [Bodo saltans virus]|uniref:RNA helicase n=1 Tax=Bodo saltans virus TaxID=2024608 RepID=A0A2H4UUS2_9VIRU|nr:DEXDc helicase [Bodo saltans virus]ATZ80672.1 DEXDc helicase [Bodo saltans virus]
MAIIDIKLNEVIYEMFPNLNISDKNILENYIIRLINVIAIYFNYDISTKQQKEMYTNQFMQNNYRDVRIMINHFLPYINTNSDIAKLTSFNDIYIKKKENIDIKSTEPKYIFSNLQYNRCIRGREYKERQFNNDDFKNNFYLMIETIRIMSNRLYPNWLNVMPYTLIEYKSSKLYKDTVERFAKRNMTYFDPCKPINQSQSTILDIGLNDMCDVMSNDNTGLYIGHIYEEIADIYYSVKDLKWILYGLENTGHNGDSVIDFLRFCFKRNEKKNLLCSNIIFEELDDKDKDFVFMVYNQILMGSQTGGSNEDRLKFSIFMLYFLMGYDKSPFSKDNDKYIKLQDFTDEFDDNNNFDDDDDNNMSESEKRKKTALKVAKFADMIMEKKKFIHRSFNTVGHIHFYEYIVDTIDKLKYTIFGLLLFNDDKTDLLSENMISDKISAMALKLNVDFKEIKLFNGARTKSNKQNINYQNIDYLNKTVMDYQDYFGHVDLPYKLIYNFAESFCHFTGENVFYALPRSWISLSTIEKHHICNRLNSTNGAGQLVNPIIWFNVGLNIRRMKLHKPPKNQSSFFLYKIYEDLHINTENSYHEDIQVKLVNLFLYTILKRLIIDIVFQSLIHKGQLTKFVPNPKKTDMSLLPPGKLNELIEKGKINMNDVFNIQDTNQYWTSSFNYLTMQRYKYMDKFAVDADSEQIDFFTFCKKNPWYAAGTYDWISQLGMCHRFINNRIILLTADTGIGKSTEMPKILLYYSKVIDCNNAPIIACTQPRKKPVDNVEYVSLTAGLPIYQWNNERNKDKKEKINTNNLYFQFKHGEDSHPKRKDYNAIIKKDYRNHPILRYMTGDMLYNQIQEPSFKRINKNDIYTNNIYDIVIVDESHEHATYMDLIMTVMKNSLSINNTLKLIIVTATIDDDEHRYRRFYRDINDNKKYPLSTFISENRLDRVNVDRRCHVSIEKGTRFPIIEHYRPLRDDKIEMELDEILLIINEIMTKPKGNILIFEPGKKDIEVLVEFLNTKTKNNVIALPFYSELPRKKQEIIEKIDKMGKDIKCSKQSNFATDNHMIGNNSYDVFIIVATNIAEASITIPNLKYVIDNGTTKKNIFSYKQRCNVLKKEDISESSRLQRKGRVGRTSPGEVYYLYEKNRMENNQIRYEFSESDIHERLFKFLRKENGVINNNALYTYDLDNPNIQEMDARKIDVKYSYITRQYFIGNRFYNYYGNTDYYDYQNYLQCPQYYDTGFDGRTLHDAPGKFYIIHPEELNIKRNIVGDIVGLHEVNNDDIKFVKCDNLKGIINSKKMVSFWKMLFDFMYITLYGTEIVRTDLCDMFSKLKMDKELLKLESNVCRTFLFSIINNCSKEICDLFSLLELIKYDVTKLYPSYKQNINGKEKTLSYFYQIPQNPNTKSDINVILDVIDNIRKNINSHSSGDLSMQNVDSFVQSFISKSEIYNRSIQEFKERENGKNKKIIEQIMSKLKQNIKSQQNQSHITPVIKTLILGFPHNFTKSITTTDYYMSLYSPLYQNIFKIEQEMSIQKKTFVNSMFLSNYVFYLKHDCTKNTISIVTHVSPQDILSCLSHIYFNNLTYDTQKKQFIINQIEKYDKSEKNKNINEYFRKANIDGNINTIVVEHVKSLMEIQNDFCNKKDLPIVIQSHKYISCIEPKMKNYLDKILQNLNSINGVIGESKLTGCQ